GEHRRARAQGPDAAPGPAIAGHAHPGAVRSARRRPGELPRLHGRARGNEAGPDRDRGAAVPRDLHRPELAAQARLLEGRALTGTDIIMMTLYSGTTDPFSQRCRNVLYEKGM